jgi:hypothetical protein
MKYPNLRRFWKLQRLVGETAGWLQLRSVHDLWRALSRAADESASTGCTFYELNVLYQQIVRSKPSKVLELGSGISTIVMGFAAKHVTASGNPCTVVSMEESEFYCNDLRRLVPAEIMDCIQLIYSPVEDRRLDGHHIARCYVAKPEHPYEFVFIDGPRIPESRTDHRYFDGDLLDVINWNRAAFDAYLDGRSIVADHLRELCPWLRMTHNQNHNFTHISVPAAFDRQKLAH